MNFGTLYEEGLGWNDDRGFNGEPLLCQCCSQPNGKILFQFMPKILPGVGVEFLGTIEFASIKMKLFIGGN